MHRNRMNLFLAGMLAAALALPLAARSNTTKNSNSGASAKVDLLKDASLGGKQVKAGTYDVKADETTLTLRQNGKVVAEAPITWKDEHSKSPYSSIVTDGSAVLEVHFNGKTRYAAIASGSTTSAGQQ